MARGLVPALFNGTADIVPTAAADVWPLGIILRRLLFKELPWLDGLNLLAQGKSLDLAPNRTKADENEAVHSRVYANIGMAFLLWRLVFKELPWPDGLNCWLG